MPNQKAKRTLAILHLLGIYILLQVCWWGYLVISVSHRLALAEGREDSVARQLWMIVGEGSVFLILLFVGFRTIRKNVLRELHFASMQNTFLLAVTHELKTPVAAIKLQLETLKNRELTAEQSSQIVSGALKEANRLEGLVGNILLTTQLDRAPVGTTQYAFNLSDVLRGEAQRFKSLYQHTREISCTIEDDVEMRGEPELMRAACFNLIENAVKYSGDGGIVSIGLKQTKDQIILDVIDNGSGIPDNEKEHVFGKFYRPGNEPTRRHKGTGLGLYIVRNAVRMHGGTVQVSDASPHGSRFTVVLPLHHAEH